MGGKGASNAQTRIRIVPTVSDASSPTGRADWIVLVLPRAARLLAAHASRRSTDPIAADVEPGEAIGWWVEGDGPATRVRASLAMRAARALRLVAASLRVRVRARRLCSRLRAEGLSCERIEVARESDGRALGIGRSRVLMAPDALVVAFSGARPKSPVDEAVAAAEDRLDSAMSIERARVLTAGPVMIELSAGDRRFLLRVAGPDAKPAIRGPASVVTRLIAANPPPGVRERLIVPLAEGELDGGAWSLEPLRRGRHPRSVGDALWRDCRGFLADLISTAGPPAEPVDERISAQVRSLAPYLDVAGRRSLDALAGDLVPRLVDLPCGWGHGDFHVGNLLCTREGLGSVLDWDAGRSDALPTLDLLHLVATSRRAVRRLPHGERCVKVLWPLARSGGDLNLRSYCEATGTPADPETLLALAQAYWLARTARDVEAFPSARTPSWLELNLRRPLDYVARAWTT
jgi:hypothetical protein